MAELKTRPTKASVSAFIGSQADEQTRRDCRELVSLMKQATGKSPKMWGTAIVGFGSAHLKYASGRELEWFLVGFSPRKGKLSLYLTCDLSQYGRLLKKLGKYKAGKGCLYIKTLDDIDRTVLKELTETAVVDAKKLTKPMSTDRKPRSGPRSA